MPNKETIPEEKLLNLIRSSNKNPPQQNSSKAADTSAQEQIAPKPAPSSTGNSAPAGKEKKILFKGIKSLNFTFINRLIMLVALVGLSLLLFDLFNRPRDLSQSQPVPETKPKILSLEEEKREPYSYYQQEIAKRQLFDSSPTEPRVKKVIPSGPTFKELIKGLKLLGIVSADRTQVVIEDAKLDNTYFLYTGDYLGQIRVEEIYSDRVVLEFKGERISLFL